MITVMPGETPVTIPVTEPIVATDVTLLLHVPPGVAQLKFVVEPTQVAPGPVIAAGSGLTVIVVVAIQPDKSM